MAHLTGTFHRPTHVAPRALAGVLVVAVIVSVALAGLVVATRPAQAPEVAAPAAYVPATTRTAILNQLNSEYLRSISGSWYVAAPAAYVPATTRAAILAQLDSEYLRSIARGWYVTAPRVNPNLLNSEYLREIARDWKAAAPALNRNLLNSEYLREIARDW
jgi:hypothetical protein